MNTYVHIYICVYVYVSVGKHNIVLFRSPMSLMMFLLDRSITERHILKHVKQLLKTVSLGFTYDQVPTNLESELPV